VILGGKAWKPHERAEPSLEIQHPYKVAIRKASKAAMKGYKFLCCLRGGEKERNHLVFKGKTAMFIAEFLYAEKGGVRGRKILGKKLKTFFPNISAAAGGASSARGGNRRRKWRSQRKKTALREKNDSAVSRQQASAERKKRRGSRG